MFVVDVELVPLTVFCRGVGTCRFRLLVLAWRAECAGDGAVLVVLSRAGTGAVVWSHGGRCSRALLLLGPGGRAETVAGAACSVGA